MYIFICVCLTLCVSDTGSEGTWWFQIQVQCVYYWIIMDKSSKASGLSLRHMDQTSTRGSAAFCAEVSWGYLDILSRCVLDAPCEVIPSKFTWEELRARARRCWRQNKIHLPWICYSDLDTKKLVLYSYLWLSISGTQ